MDNCEHLNLDDCGRACHHLECVDCGLLIDTPYDFVDEGILGEEYEMGR